MRTSEQGVPRLAQLGATCYYTHRASSFDGWKFRDVGLHYTAQRDAYNRLAGAVGYARYVERKRLPKPKRITNYSRQGRFMLDRWVAVWPECGYGVVTGMVRRTEGTKSYSDDYPSYDQWETYSLYQVRRNLTSSPVLVPVWALVPQLRGWSWGMQLEQDAPPVPWRDSTGPPTGLGADGAAWQEYVEAWLSTRAAVVVA